MAYRTGEDVMIARTTQHSAPSGRSGGLLNVHHDRHKSDERVATFMVYLSTVDSAAGHGGETYFPVAGAAQSDALWMALEQEHNSGCRLLTRDASLTRQCETRLEAWRRGQGYRLTGQVSNEGAEPHGVGTVPTAGVAVVFDAGGQGVEAGAWHGPCAVTGPEEKWTLTFFKSPAPVWSSAMLGV